ncbi:MAG: tetratricopeptide repeat protein [Limisphaerales bacterium]
MATGRVSGDVTAASGDWFEIRDRLAEHLLKELAVRPTDVEREKMIQRGNTSLAGFEWLCKAMALKEQKRGFAEIGAAVRGAVEADPQSARALDGLAAILSSEGKMDEGEQRARQAAALRPDRARPHLTLGHLLLLEGKGEDARKELQAAAQAGPDDAEPYRLLGEIDVDQEAPDKAIQDFSQALQLNPFSAATHADLARVYLNLGKKDLAVAQLNEVERLASPDDLNAEQLVVLAYDNLHDVARAAQHCERFITAAKEQGLNPEIVRSFEANYRELKERLTPVYLTLTPPRAYTAATVNQFLREKLTPQQLNLVTNPLAFTPAMDRWAHGLVHGAATDLEKAQRLFDTLTHHLNPMEGSLRTAEEVFAAWDDPGASFSCEENANLYVALARAVGLKAFFVEVDEESDGRKALHACAAVFFPTNALLADPSYLWFGAPHRKFTVLDDLQAIALHLSELHDLGLARIACSVAPDFTFVWYTLLGGLVDAGGWDEVARRLPVLERLDGEGWMADLIRGEFAEHQGELEKAAALLQKATQLSPECGAAYAWLGDVYAKQGKLREERDAIRQALGCQLGEGQTSVLRKTLSKLNEALGADSGGTHFAQAVTSQDVSAYVARANEAIDHGQIVKAITELDEAIQLNPKASEAYRWRGFAYDATGEHDRAINDLSHAVRLNPTDAAAFGMRGVAYAGKGDYDQAIADYNAGLRLRSSLLPKDALVLLDRGIAYEHKNDFQSAIADFKEAIRLKPQEALAYFNLASLRVACPVVSLRNGKEAVTDARKACELTGWKEYDSVELLAAAETVAGDFDRAIKYEKQALRIDGVPQPAHDLMIERLVHYQLHDTPNQQPK